MPSTQVKKPLSEYVTFFMDSTQIDTDLIIKSVGYQMRKHGRIVKGDFDQTISTWNSKPTMGYTVKKEKGELVLRAGLKEWAHTGRHGGSKDEWKWVWLQIGTKERWAVMSSDWKSKTSVGSIKAGAGAGYVTRRGKSQMVAPKPGIKARKFVQAIDKNRFPKYVDDMNKTLARISKRIWK